MTSSEDKRGLYILVVEDAEAIRTAIVSMLEAEGYKVDSTATAEDGFEKLQDSTFDLVISDHHLPKNSGMWLLTEAKNRKLLDRTAMLMISADANNSQFDPIAFLRKPLDLDSFLSKVEELLTPAREKLIRELEGVELKEVKQPKNAPIQLTLYVTTSSSSLKAIANLTKLLKRYGADRVSLEVHDLSKDHSPTADEDQSLAPTLVRRAPGPKAWVLGSLDNPEAVTSLIIDAQPETKK